ncbi:MAG: vanadium-dependent haloperoxidase [Burkholderiales bacterium]
MNTATTSIIALTLSLAACGGSGANERSVTITSTGPNVVSYWNDIANRTVNVAAAINVTPEEQRPTYQVDLATVHLAVYDAVTAIDGRYQPYAITPVSSAAGASMDAAASAAAYGVLHALFPNRGAQYEAAYEDRLRAIPDGDAKTRGIALGSEVATGIVALRANDGRAVALAPYVSGTAPGKFRSANATPVYRYVPFIKPFSLTRVDQFRPGGPPPLDSAAYAIALNDSKATGGTLSAVRTAEQLEVARFQTEAPAPFITRNFGRFATSTADVAEAARLMALLYVVHADAVAACFEAKYFYEAWRPFSAIPLADTDNNAATTSDAAWTPVLSTPNHPEYPAGHSCSAGGLGEALRQFYGTRQVAYTFDSAVTGATRSYASTDALADESEVARVVGGMHFRFSTVDGVALGTHVAQWVAAHHFARRNP